MQAVVPHRWFDRIAMALVLLSIVIPVTYLEINFIQLQHSPAASGIQRILERGANQAEPAGSSVVRSKPVNAAAATTKKTASTTSYVHLRAGKSTSSAIVTNIEAGTGIELRDEADATWQGVTYQGKAGFIYRTYLQY